MRLIDADKLIKAIEDFFANICVYDVESFEAEHDFESIVDKMETVNEWIPCSERLPEEGEVVLTHAKFKDDIKMAVSSRIDYNYWTGWGTREINIVAWMPLPQPYRGDEHE